MSDTQKIKRKKPSKVVIIGDSNVGKTCIIERFIHNTFEKTQPTIGACHFNKKYMDVDLDIWDTAGQERFRSMIPMYFKGSKGIIICFDITDVNTFEGAKKWIKEIEQNVEKGRVFLVGNKCDLEDRKVPSEMVSNYAHSNDYEYIETSAKENINIDVLFKKIAEKIKEMKEDEVNNVDIKKSFNNDEDDSLCGCS
jgi:Ras-related protein Rab-5C